LFFHDLVPLSHGRSAPSAAAREDLWLACISGLFPRGIGLGKTDPGIGQLQPMGAGHMLGT
jgi:hypothetical protein